jgi:hypothetical protein
LKTGRFHLHRSLRFRWSFSAACLIPFASVLDLYRYSVKRWVAALSDHAEMVEGAPVQAGGHSMVAVLRAAGQSEGRIRQRSRRRASCRRRCGMIMFARDARWRGDAIKARSSSRGYRRGRSGRIDLSEVKLEGTSGMNTATARISREETKMKTLHAIAGDKKEREKVEVAQEVVAEALQTSRKSLPLSRSRGRGQR